MTEASENETLRTAERIRSRVEKNQTESRKRRGYCPLTFHRCRYV
ncbi:hypothetical protein KZ770_17280 [Escherichia coli]|nr:hypothetical protein [Escherichia coli]